jgi:outer membrane protein OmpA-like peptidoglycan-associated protein
MIASIAETERGHRRGVVLGFTMAELLLLLLFCLLLVSATALLEKENEIDQLKVLLRAADTVEDTEQLRYASQLQVLLQKLYPGGIPNLTEADFAKLWDKIVLARDVETATNEAGLESPKELEQLLTVWGEMRGRFASEEELDEVITVLEQLVNAGAGSLTTSQLEMLVTGVAAGPGNVNGPPGSRWPPIISLDGNRYRFRIGSAEITPDFEYYLVNEAAAKIADLLTQYGADVIEIVGHTDEQVIEPREETVSNLDRFALPSVNGETNEELTPVDNAGLGLARAIEVARVLRVQPELVGMKIVPLSAGQLLRKGDVLSPGGGESLDDADRRRIEIRVRRSTPETN